MYILCVIIFMSCITAAVKIPRQAEPQEAQPSPLETVIRKVKLNSPAIEKFFDYDKTDGLTVKTILAAIRHETGKAEFFRVRYDLGKVWTDSSGAFVVPFTVRDLDNAIIAEDKLMWEPKNDASGILLSFDDYYRNIWEQYFNLFDRYKARVTFFVQGTYNPFYNDVQKRGHEVGYHTLSHLNLSKISREAFYTETVSQVKNFRNAGVPLSSFAYPYGLHESWMNEELLKTFKIIRGFNTGFQIYKRAAIKDGFIISKSIDNLYFRQDDDFRAAIDLMLRTVKFLEQDLVLPISSHTISDNTRWGIKPERLEYLLQSAGKLRLNFYRYSDFF